MADPKLNRRHKTLVKSRIVAGDSNGEIRRRLRLAGFADELTDQAFTYYRRDPEVIQALAAAHEAAMNEGIASRSNRLRDLQALRDKWFQVIEERAADPELADIAGGTSGLIVKQIKMVGQGAAAELVEEYVVDAAISREVRAIGQQAAQELGQWKEVTKTENEMSDRDRNAIESLDGKLAGLAARIGAASVPANADTGGSGSPSV